MSSSFRLAALTFLLIVVGIAFAAESNVSRVPEFAGGVPSSAVFNSSGFFAAAHECLEQFPFAQYQAQADQRQKDCLAAWMKHKGAGPQAIAFMRLAPVPATIAAIRNYGPVDLIHAAMLWADASDGWALVGKSGEMVALWNPPKLNSDAQYKKFKAQHPDAILWTDTLTWPQVRNDRDGGRELVFGFSLKVCRACAKLGSAEVGYQFDRQGRFDGQKLLWIAVSKPPA